MTVKELLAGVAVRSGVPAGSVPESWASEQVKGLDFDSRRAGPGFLFFAFPGARVDGRVFAAQAVERGALAVVSELPAPADFPDAGIKVPWIEVEHGRRALALAAKAFYGKLDEKLSLTGITGTNGKTTTSYLIDSILRAAGKTTLLAGTIEYRLGPKVLPAANTTPESLDLHRMFAELDAMGGTHATMEISSHALALGRVYGLHFHTAVFTNLTRDHLDFHNTMEDYFAAKQLLFSGSGGPAPRFSVINRDDEWGKRLGTASTASEKIWYGLGPDAMVRARHIRSAIDGLRFEVVFDKTRITVRSPLIGKVNVYNILAACWVGMAYQLATGSD